MINLVAITATHWRDIRTAIRSEGIAQPMAVLNLHELLDCTETLVMRSFVSKNPKKDEADREQFQNSLYRPSLDVTTVTDSGYKPAPAGFDEDDTADAFDTALTTLTGYSD